MAKFMKQDAVIDMAVTYFPAFLRSRRQAKILDSWMNGTQYLFSIDDNEMEPDNPAYGRPYSPSRQDTNTEYENLRGLSPNNFAGLVVASVAQTAYLEGIRRPGENGQLKIWETFMRNRWLAKQSAVHRHAIGQGVAYGAVLPGEDPLTSTKMSKMIGRSAVDMTAFYDSDDDEWSKMAIEAYPRYEDMGGLGTAIFAGWTVRIWDAYVIHHLTCKGDGTERKDWSYISHDVHNIPVPPVARCANRLDLEGRARGEIEPILPILRRVDQDLFDRLINQRFGAWQVRYISGMAKPTKQDAAEAQAMRLRVEDLLISTSEKTKFGVLPAGSLENQIKATDADLRLLSAIAQVPPHHLLGLSSNLQAEALAAAEAGLQRKSFDFRTNAAEFHEQMARLCAMAEGDMVTAAAWDLQVRWRDTESRSMTQAADALGKLAVQLKVPIEMLWERIPGWTDTDVQRAKELVENGDFQKLLEQLLENEGGQQQDQPTQESTSGDSQ